jgi:hypothetical protein
VTPDAAAQLAILAVALNEIVALATGGEKKVLARGAPRRVSKASPRLTGRWPRLSADSEEAHRRRLICFIAYAPPLPTRVARDLWLRAGIDELSVSGYPYFP